MLTIGFSTGALAHGDFARALQWLEGTFTEAIELSALRARELPALLAALPTLRGKLQHRYSYISVHAPTDFVNETDLVRQLSAVAALGWNIVAHPDTMRDAALWRSLGHSLCIENMDSRKETGRTVSELSKFFDVLPEARLCFDIAHARQFDPTMTEAACILSAFGNRLVQIHLSEVDGTGHHFAMSLAAKLAYTPFLEVLSKVPIILEPIVQQDEIEAEIEQARWMFSHHLGPSRRSMSGGYSYITNEVRVAGE